MAINITFSEDAALALSIARDFLLTQPVRHNLILSLLHARIMYPEPGRYWVAAQDQEILGVMLQSPLTFAAVLTPMKPIVIAALVDTIVDAGIVLPGVNGEAATAASFAGHWAERRRSPAVAFQGMRLYELADLKRIGIIDGQLRQAASDDRTLLIDWVRAFNAETEGDTSDPEPLVDRWLAVGQLWLWDNGKPMSMAVARQPVGGVSRLSGVYTPAESRGLGYAAACVYGLSKSLREAGYRCVLYTDLGNPTSNSIYRRLGYKAVAENLRYRFD
jgi:ribosomal protein S18 acetylase RimI-like enzyme